MRHSIMNYDNEGTNFKLYSSNYIYINNEITKTQSILFFETESFVSIHMQLCDKFLGIEVAKSFRRDS